MKSDGIPVPVKTQERPTLKAIADRTEHLAEVMRLLDIKSKKLKLDTIEASELI